MCKQHVLLAWRALGISLRPQHDNPPCLKHGLALATSHAAISSYKSTADQVYAESRGRPFHANVVLCGARQAPGGAQGMADRVSRGLLTLWNTSAALSTARSLSEALPV